MKKWHVLVLLKTKIFIIKIYLFLSIFFMFIYWIFIFTLGADFFDDPTERINMIACVLLVMLLLMLVSFIIYHYSISLVEKIIGQKLYSRFLFNKFLKNLHDVLRNFYEENEDISKIEFLNIDLKISRLESIFYVLATIISSIFFILLQPFSRYIFIMPLFVIFIIFNLFKTPISCTRFPLDINNLSVKDYLFDSVTIKEIKKRKRTWRTFNKSYQFNSLPT